MSVQSSSLSTSFPNDEVGAYTGNQVDAILRVTSYHRRDFDLAVIHFDPRQFDSVRSSVFKSFAPNPSGSSLGRLGCLPFEILKTICLFLDVSSGTCFSKVNRRAREIIAKIWEYRQLGEHALGCLCALLRTGVAPHIDIMTLYSAMTTKNCSLCDSFAGFVFLPTVTRCCFSCIKTAPFLRAVSSRKLSKETGTPHLRLKKEIPILHTLPGLYGLEELQRTRKTFIVAERHCLEELLRTGTVAGGDGDGSSTAAGGGVDPQATFDSWPQSPILSFMASTSLPYYDPATGDVQIGICCKGCQVAMEAGPSDETFQRRECVYSREEFLDHFRICDKAKGLWALSHQGTMPVQESEFIRWGGFFKERYSSAGSS